MIYEYYRVTCLTVADPGEEPGWPGSPLFLDQNEARRAEKIFFETAPPPPSSQGLDDLQSPPLPLSEGLDPPLFNERSLCVLMVIFSKE